jgi:DNA-directed RNA polymerase specialized sigma24 family protein
MARTFEELAGSELDALYQGALFLSGGDRSGAERLLVEAVTLAFRERVADTEIVDARRWLEARLARAFLRAVQEGPKTLPADTVRRISLDSDTFDLLDADALYDAAASLPPGPRVALWLVLLRRWSYADAARILGVDEEELRVLLGYRDVLLREMLGRGRDGRSRTGTQ